MIGENFMDELEKEAKRLGIDTTGLTTAEILEKIDEHYQKN